MDVFHLLLICVKKRIWVSSSIVIYTRLIHIHRNIIEYPWWVWLCGLPSEARAKYPNSIEPKIPALWWLSLKTAVWGKVASCVPVHFGWKIRSTEVTTQVREHGLRICISNRRNIYRLRASPAKYFLNAPSFPSFHVHPRSRRHSHHPPSSL